ncbi:hypothetical protein NDU88_008235 [Pleurodeles waltl]|uniref:Uncharacterized protein n=1 Tax=Pleurodeles waltl TaxID=8319 RepID=A0AAV7QR64_PLEWA|nr:hypothetical protein NDU88_008235 [Pleurodeles waltl]
MDPAAGRRFNSERPLHFPASASRCLFSTPDLLAFSFSSSPGEVNVLPALLGCSGGAGTLVLRSLISDPFLHVAAPQASRPTVAATI